MTPEPESKSTQSASDQNTSPPAEKQRRFRWKIPVVILLIAGVAYTIVWFQADGDSSQQVVMGLAIWSGTALLMCLWWLFFSGLRVRSRMIGLAIAGVAVGIFGTTYQFDGFTGDIIPRFRLRTDQSAEQRAAEYFESQSSESNAVDVSEQLEITEADWPRFRGPLGDGIVRGESIRRDWDANPPTEVWRHPIGPAWSSFSIVGNLLFTQEQRGDEEAVACYDTETGDQVWVHTDPARYSTSMGGTGPRATPTIHDSRLYALGATGILNCLDPLNGNVLWSTNIVEDAEAKLLGWGMSGSPLLFDNLVVVNAGGKNDAGVAAYDRMTGQKVWASGSRQAGYTAPLLTTIDGVRQILIYHAFGIAGHDPNSGKELWWKEWKNGYGNNIVQPIVLEDGAVFVSSGYNTGSALLDVKQQDGNWTVTSRWERPNKFKLKFNGGIYKDGHIYGLDEGIFSCFDLSSGKRTWKKGRYKFGQILLVDDLFLVSTESGEVVLVEATPKSMRELARFQAIEGKTWNHPVLNRGRLYIRNDEEIACYDLRPESQTASVD